MHTATPRPARINCYLQLFIVRSVASDGNQMSISALFSFCFNKLVSFNLMYDSFYMQYQVKHFEILVKDCYTLKTTVTYLSIIE